MKAVKSLKTNLGFDVLYKDVYRNGSYSYKAFRITVKNVSTQYQM
jgi:hypothetical protein